MFFLASVDGLCFSGAMRIGCLVRPKYADGFFPVLEILSEPGLSRMEAERIFVDSNHKQAVFIYSDGEMELWDRLVLLRENWTKQIERTQ